MSSGLNKKLLLAICAAAIGSAFQHGYNTSVLNNPQKVLEAWISNVTFEKTGTYPSSESVTFIFSLMTSLFCLGGMVGGLLTGFFADRFGRKGALLINNIFVLITVIFECVAKPFGSYWALYIGRFFIGINSGLNAGIVPMYLSEITPVKLRGAVGSVYQLVIVISILLSIIMGMDNVMGTEDLWPYLLAITILPALFQLVTLPFCTESPKYLLIVKNQESKARKALSWLRDGAEINDELAEMKSEAESIKTMAKVTLKELITNESLKAPLIIVLTIMAAQQLSGINAIMFFSNSIFESANLDKQQAQMANLAMTIVNVLMTFVSMVLVDKAGRKTLLLTGFVGMTINTFFLAIMMKYTGNHIIISWLCVVLVLVFIIMFASGPGSIPWFLVSELFNQSARPIATSLAVGCNWLANFIVAVSFPSLQLYLGSNVFYIFVVLQALFSIFIFKKVPETKNKTIEEISAIFRQQSYNK